MPSTVPRRDGRSRPLATIPEIIAVTMSALALLISLLVSPAGQHAIATRIPQLSSDYQAGLKYIKLRNGGEDRDAMNAMALAHPNSPAWEYAHFVDLLNRVNKQSGKSQRQGSETFEDPGGVVRSCNNDFTVCTTYSEFKTDRGSGLVRDFLVNGRSISSRVASSGQPSICDQSICIQILSAMITLDGQSVNVVASVSNMASDSIYPDLDDSQYVSLGTPGFVRPTDFLGLNRVDYGDSTLFRFTFPANSLGGQLFFAFDARPDVEGPTHWRTVPVRQ